MHGAREVNAIQQGIVHTLTGQRQVSREALLLVLQGQPRVICRVSMAEL